jgi:hypothetical protein
LSIPDDYARRKFRCPQCGVYAEVPEPRRKQPAPAEPAARQDEEPAIPEPAWQGPDLPADVWPDRGPQAAPYAQPVESALEGTEEDDGKPYRCAGPLARPCPDCKTELAPDAKLCPHCGLNLETGERAVRSYEPAEYHWESGLPFQKRIKIFIFCQLVLGVPAVSLALFFGYWTAALTPWFCFTALLSFVLGTFDRLDLTRNKRGRVVLTQTWRVCFLARPTVTIPLREYEGIVVNLSHDVGMTDRIVLVVGFAFAIVPGLIWWLWAMQQDTFHVALTQRHGYPERYLYRGWSQTRAQEIAQVLHELSGLPYEGSGT